MFKLFYFQIISSLLLFSSFSYSRQYYQLPSDFKLYERECSSQRVQLSQRILDDSLGYCKEDQDPYLAGCQLVKPPVFDESSLHACSFTDVKRDNILYLGIGTHISESCLFVSSILGANYWDKEEIDIKIANKSKKESEKQKPAAYFFCKDARSHETCDNMSCQSSSSNKNHTSKVFSKEARPCINKNYITAITKAFNEMTACFGFSNTLDKGRLFTMLFVESRFLLNKVEDSDSDHSTNRCFGQLYNGVIQTLNQYIYFQSEEEFDDYSTIYQNAVDERCPFLPNLVTPDLIHFEGTSLKGDNSTFRQVHKKYKDHIICRTSQDPYPCLFYSIYNAKRNLVDIENKLKEVKTDKNKSHFYINGTKLFDNEDDLMWSFVIWAHSGGNSIIQDRFPAFIKQLKNRIINPDNICKTLKPCQNVKNSNDPNADCKEDCDKRYREYKESLSQEKSLSTVQLHKEFSLYAKEQKKTLVNPVEVSSFMTKIETDLPDLINKNQLNVFNVYKNEEVTNFIEKEVSGNIITCPTHIKYIFDDY